MTFPALARDGWMRHEHFLTYRIANYAETVVTEPYSFINGLLQGLVANDGIVGFLPNWQKYSALHRFVAFIADEMFASDSRRPSLINLAPDRLKPRWVLSVDAAFARYGFQAEPFDPGVEDTDERDEAYSEYFAELRWSADYAHLLDRLADEVFFVMFTNRAALYALNKFLARYVEDLDPDGFGSLEGRDDLGALFATEGRIARKTPPVWARRAVYFRERGCCAQCGRDLSGLLSTLAVPHFDHMVPLASGGLNDVTNLQMLCGECNQRKGARPQRPSRRLQHWYRVR